LDNGSVTVSIRVVFALLVLAVAAGAHAEQPSLDQGYRQMYNLSFDEAHHTFQAWEVLHPRDPMGPVSDGAAYLFQEFERLRVLESEFFTDDESFFARQRALNPDPTVKRAFETALARTELLAAAALKSAPNDLNAMFASLLRLGLRADFLALIEKRNLAALTEIKQSRAIADQLLARHPSCYDAYLAAGVENYMLSLKPAPVRWLLRWGGAQTDKQAGIDRLRITAEKGHYLLPYARLLLAVAALRDRNKDLARRQLAWLASEYPRNRLYRQELEKLKK
jgi:hypothetical protein